MTDKKQSRKDAEDLGSKARGVGLGVDANVFGKDTYLGDAWLKGWKRRDKKKRGMGT